MPTEKPRFSVTMDHDMLNKVNQFRVKNGIKTQSKAMVSIMRLALNDIEKSGLVEKALINPDYEKLFAVYQALNAEGQEKLLDYADDLVQSGKYKKSGAAGLGGTEKIG